MEKFIDLHIHSTASDGACSPSEIVDMAVKMDLAVIALTDHDTVSGIEEFLACSDKYPQITLVPGVEISVDLYGNEAHIVGLFVDHNCYTLNKLLQEVRGNRDRRNVEIVTKLQKQGFDVTIDEILEVAGGESVGRPHFAKVLIEKGYFNETQEVFDKCLKKGSPAYCKRKLPSPEQAISEIHNAGGVTIWAHPVYRRNDERSYVRKTIKKLVKHGLEGIETYYTTFTPDQHDLLKEFAEEYNLVVSGGSDFHGQNQPSIALGRGFGNLEVPEKIYYTLKKYHENKKT